MTASSVHRIRRHRWTIRTATGAEAFAIRAWVRSSWERELLPAIERAFDRLDPGDDLVCVPRLEIRLTVPAGAAGQVRLRALLEESVARELSALVVGSGMSGAAPAAEWRTEGEDRFATLIRYLRRGTLPWVAAGVRPPHETVRELRATARSERARLAPLVGRGAGARHEIFRLLQLLGDEASTSLPLLAPNLSRRWSAALARLLGRDPEAIGELHDELGPPAWHLRLAAAAALLAEARSADGSDRAGAIAVVRDAVSAGEYEVLEPFLRVCLGEDGGRGKGPAPATLEPRSGAPAGQTTPPMPAPPRARDSTPEPPAAVSSPVSPPTTADSASAPPRVAGANDEHPLAVANTGLILLHPYLERLFSATGIVAGRAIPDESRPRAAALLHQLATGREEIHELELGLVKLLLGLDPEDSFPVAEGLLGPADLEECTALLAAVIQHWSALGRTSVAGLRTSFLQRDGLLRRVEAGWALHVDPAGFDVLLAHLPWSVSVVRLPWMPEPVYTEWTTTP